jgi:hypothetical protein
VVTLPFLLLAVIMEFDALFCTEKSITAFAKIGLSYVFHIRCIGIGYAARGASSAGYT